MALPDYYAILDVSSDATFDEIKHAYWRMARLYHPDVNRRGTDDQIKRINEAYDVLGDAARRVTYDIQRLEEKKHEVILDFLIHQRELQRRRRKRMTWKEGAVGFVRELRRNMREG
jgi:curved DNA-binding protein CbpA